MGPCLVPRLFHSSFCWLSLPRSPSFHRPLLLLSLLLLNAGLPPLLLRRTHAPTHPPTHPPAPQPLKLAAALHPYSPKKPLGRREAPVRTQQRVAGHRPPSSNFPFSPPPERERESLPAPPPPAVRPFFHLEPALRRGKGGGGGGRSPPPFSSSCSAPSPSLRTRVRPRPPPSQKYVGTLVHSRSERESSEGKIGVGAIEQRERSLLLSLFSLFSSRRRPLVVVRRWRWRWQRDRRQRRMKEDELQWLKKTRRPLLQQNSYDLAATSKLSA